MDHQGKYRRELEYEANNNMVYLRTNKAPTDPAGGISQMFKNVMERKSLRDVTAPLIQYSYRLTSERKSQPKAAISSDAMRHILGHEPRCLDDQCCTLPRDRYIVLRPHNKVMRNQDPERRVLQAMSFSGQIS
jgi:hypothetical protein